MRGCVSVLLLAAIFAVVVAWFGAPAIAGAGIQLALAGAGLDARESSVRVDSDPPIDVLGGHADRVTISAAGATFEDIDAERVSVVLARVDLVGRTFATVDGTLDGVRLRGADRAVPIARIELHGAATAATAIATMVGGDVERLAAGAINDALGLPVGGASLQEPDILRLTIAGQSVDGRLVVEPTGGLALALPLPGTPRVPLFDAAAIEVTSVTVLDGTLVVTGTVDLTDL